MVSPDKESTEDMMGFLEAQVELVNRILDLLKDYPPEIRVEAMHYLSLQFEGRRKRTASLDGEG